MSLRTDSSTPRAAVVSLAGPTRACCEDAAHADAGGHFFLVADGLGGHAGGRIASAMAVQIVRDALEDGRARIAELAERPTDEARRAVIALIDGAVRAAHRALYVRGSTEADQHGMVANLDVVVVAGAEAVVAHVGDTRTYLIRDGEAAPITTDHTLAEVMVLEGTLSASDAACSPFCTVLVNAVGASLSDVVVEIASVPLCPGDRLLLSTDGLHDAFPDEDALAERLSSDNPDQALAAAVAWALAHGGRDDITGVLVDVPAALDDDGDGAWFADVTSRWAKDDSPPRDVWDAVVIELRDHA